MNLLRYELKKLLTLPMLWVFVALCLLLNLCITLGYRYKVMDYDFFSYVTETASQTGTVLGDDFTEKLSALPERPERAASSQRPPICPPSMKTTMPQHWRMPTSDCTASPVSGRSC